MAADDTRHKVLVEAFSKPSCSVAYVNGAINKMKKEDIREQLRLLYLDDRLVNFNANYFDANLLETWQFCQFNVYFSLFIAEVLKRC